MRLLMFLLGFACALALAGVVLLKLPQHLPRGLVDPCRACGEGTRCDDGVRCVAANLGPAPVTRRKGGKRSSGAAGPGATGSGAAGAGAAAAGTGDAAAEAPAVVLKPADLRLVSTGDALQRTEVVDFNRDEGAGRELSQEDLDSGFRPHQAEVLACVDQARGEAALTGQLTVSFRVSRAGAITGVRVEAPSYLVQRGLLPCVRSVLQGLHYPASSGAQVVSYPFQLR